MAYLNTPPKSKCKLGKGYKYNANNLFMQDKPPLSTKQAVFITHRWLPATAVTHLAAVLRPLQAPKPFGHRGRWPTRPVSIQCPQASDKSLITGLGQPAHS